MVKAYFEYGDDFMSSSVFNTYLTTRPKLTMPAARNKNTVVAGRNGDLLASDKTFDNAVLDLSCVIRSESLSDIQTNIAKLQGWLSKRTYVPLSFFFDKEHYYKAAYQGGMTVENTRKTGLATNIGIKFTTKPFRYIRNVEPITTTGTVKNPYWMYSEPKIVIEGQGKVTLTVNGEEYKIKNLIDNITIDSELMTTYRTVGDKVQSAEGDILNFEYPTLQPGDNTVNVKAETGSVSGIKIYPNWRE